MRKSDFEPAVLMDLKDFDNPIARRVLRRRNANVGYGAVDRVDPVASRCIPSLATQQGMGIWSQWNYWCSAVDRVDSFFAGQNIGSAWLAAILFYLFNGDRKVCHCSSMLSIPSEWLWLI
ncbi:hypothetical protein [Acidithiobacillus sp.]